MQMMNPRGTCGRVGEVGAWFVVCVIVARFMQRDCGVWRRCLHGNAFAPRRHAFTKHERARGRCALVGSKA